MSKNLVEPRVPLPPPPPPAGMEPRRAEVSKGYLEELRTPERFAGRRIPGLANEPEEELQAAAPPLAALNCTPPSSSPSTPSSSCGSSFPDDLPPPNHLDTLAKNKMAADYINNPIESYHEMQTTIYGDRLATGKYAKGSSEPLGATATSKLAKKAKKDAGEEEDLISTLWRVGSELAAAIVTAGQKSAPQPPPETVDEIPDNLYETLLGMEGYSEAQIACYFAFLVENPKVAKAFMKMGHIGQLIWMARYISKEFKD